MLLRLINIKTRLIAAFLILSFIPLLVIGTFSYNKSSKAIESKAENYSTELLKQVGNNVKTEMVKLNSVFNDILISKEMTDLLNSYSANSSSKVEAEIAIKMLISKKLSLINGATGAQIRVGNEKIDFGSTGLSEEQAESAAEAAKSSSGSLNFKSDVSGGENVFVVMKEVKAREVQGVFLVTLKEEVLSVGYKDVDLGSNAGILIVDKEGKVVSSADNKRFPVNAAFENTALAGYLQNDSQEAKNAVSLEVYDRNHPLQVSSERIQKHRRSNPYCGLLLYCPGIDSFPGDFTEHIKAPGQSCKGHGKGQGRQLEPETPGQQPG